MPDESTSTLPEQPAKRGRGRPKGSRNKRTGMARRAPHAARASGPTHSTRRRTTLDPVPGGLTASLREAVASQMQPCPHCGAEPRNKGRIAQEIGISQMTLRKFVRDGQVSGPALDRIYAYVNKGKQG